MLTRNVCQTFLFAWPPYANLTCQQNLGHLIISLDKLFSVLFCKLCLEASEMSPEDHRPTCLLCRSAYYCINNSSEQVRVGFLDRHMEMLGREKKKSLELSLKYRHYLLYVLFTINLKIMYNYFNITFIRWQTVESEHVALFCLYAVCL